MATDLCEQLVLIVFRPGVGFLMQVFLYHPATFKQLHGDKRSVIAELQRVDAGGIFLLVAGLVLFLLGISWGGNPKPWTSPLILGLLITGALLVVIFVIFERFTPSPNPFIDMTLFKDIRGYTCLVILSSAAGALYIGLTIVWPQRESPFYGPLFSS